MQTLLVAVRFFTMPQVLWAQNDQTDWVELSPLQSGERIRALDSGHKKHTGLMSSFSEQSIILSAKTGEGTIPRENIIEISRSKRSHRVRNVSRSRAGGSWSRSRHFLLGAAMQQLFKVWGRYERPNSWYRRSPGLCRRPSGRRLHSQPPNDLAAVSGPRFPTLHRNLNARNPLRGEQSRLRLGLLVELGTGMSTRREL